MGLLGFIRRLFGSQIANEASLSSPEAQYSVWFDTDQLATDYPSSETSKLLWRDIDTISIRTTSDGPFKPDFWWCFLSASQKATLSFPQEVSGENSLLSELHGRYPAFDDESFAGAICSTDNATFVIWDRQKP